MRFRSSVSVGLLSVLVAAGLSGCSLFGDDDPVRSTSGAPATTTAPATAGPTGPAAGSAEPSATPDAAGAPVPANVPGYAMAPASGAAQRTIQAQADKLRNSYTGPTVRTVLKGKDPIGTLTLLGLKPELRGNQAVESVIVPSLLKGVAAGRNVKTSTQKIGGHDVAVGVLQTQHVVLWYDKGVVAFVVAAGTDPTNTLAFAKAYLGAS